jgi:hypothetical protein
MIKKRTAYWLLCGFLLVGFFNPVINAKVTGWTEELLSATLGTIDTGTKGDLSDDTWWLRVSDLVKNNLTASTDPGATDDIDEDYEPGSVWVNNNTPSSWICLDNTDDAASWQQIGAGGGSGTVTASGTPANDEIAVWTSATDLEGWSYATFAAAVESAFITQIQLNDWTGPLGTGAFTASTTELLYSNAGVIDGMPLFTYSGSTLTVGNGGILHLASGAQITGVLSWNLSGVDKYLVSGTQLGKATETFENKTVDIDDNTIQDLDFEKERTISNPTTDDDCLWFKAKRAITLAAFDCIAEGSTPSISVDLQECNSSGTSCSSVLSSAVTANGGTDSGTISDSTIDSGDWVKVVLGTPSGTVNFITFQVSGTQTY